jgi:hypothetical protein
MAGPGGNVRPSPGANDAGAIVGACAFRWREYSDAPAAWALQWVWVCPKARRTGVLRARWRSFRERYGDFHIEPPVSAAMQGFVRAMGDAALLGPQDVETAVES